MRLINRVKADMGERIRVMSVDIPTGLEADTGRVANDCIIADITMTFAMVKEEWSYSRLGYVRSDNSWTT